MLVREKIDEGKWKFGIDGSSLSTENFRLRRDGTTSGHSDGNISKWLFRDQKIHLLDGDGKTITVLQKTPSNSKEEIWSGCSLANENLVYTLKRRSKNVRCFFRTHIWDAHVEAMYEQVSKCWGSRPIITADMTKPFRIPSDLTVLRHTRSSIVSNGLPLAPEGINALWYNGDYVIYDLLFKSDWDFAFLLEYDLFTNLSLQDLATRLIADGIDYAAFNVDRSGPEWCWHNKQIAAFAAWHDFYDTKPSTPSTPFGSLFPLVFISREAAVSLFAKRLEYGRIRKFKGDDMWSFCESFVPSELHNQNFKITNVSDYLPKKYHVHVTEAMNLVEAQRMDCSLVHPVLSGDRLIEKIFAHATISLGVSDAEAIDWLNKRDTSSFHSDEMSMYQALLKNLVSLAEGSSATP